MNWTKWLKEVDKPNISIAKMQFDVDFTKHFAIEAISSFVFTPVLLVYECFQLIPTDLAQTFHTLALQLETQSSEKDYQPNSNNQVLNLIHPSLYCLVYGVTRSTPSEQYPKDLNDWKKWLGTGEIINYQPNDSLLPTNSFSKRFQWLPSEFHVNLDGTVEIKSYINNLHPREHPQLYSCIGSIFAKFVPLFEHVLTFFTNQRPVMIDQLLRSQIVLLSCDDWCNDDVQEPLPELFNFHSFNKNDVLKKRISLRGTDLQVIVKMANIELTPEKPNYPGGSWHVQGLANEGIVATGIYYYECQNITNLQLSFQYSYSGVEFLYGLPIDQSSYEPLGSVSIDEGRCIAFPNYLQHQVQPFELLDKTKCGSRKILAFFLINPNVSITSTINVPPQQRSWMHKEINVKSSQAGVGSFIVPSKDEDDRSIKSIINENVETFIDWPMSHGTALKYRLELMEDHKFIRGENNEFV